MRRRTDWPMPSGTRVLATKNPETKWFNVIASCSQGAGHGCMLALFLRPSEPAYKSVGFEDLKQFPAVGLSKSRATGNLRDPGRLRSPPARSVRARQRPVGLAIGEGHMAAKFNGWGTILESTTSPSDHCG